MVGVMAYDGNMVWCFDYVCNQLETGRYFGGESIFITTI